MSSPSANVDSQLLEIQDRCGLGRTGAYFLRVEAAKTVRVQVRPEVRARPLKYTQMECLRVELGKIGFRLAAPPRQAKPATAADLQSHLDRIHFFCELGPYQLKAWSATRAYITIPPTWRVDPLSRRKHRCVKEAVENIRGVKLEPGFVPTVD
jgi:hypothetical protein